MSRHSDCVFDTSLLLPVGMIRVKVAQSQHASVHGGGRVKNGGAVEGKTRFHQAVITGERRSWT